MKRLATLLLGMTIVFLYSCAPTKTGDFTSQKYTNFKKGKQELVLHQPEQSSSQEGLAVAAVEGEESGYEKPTAPKVNKVAPPKLSKPKLSKVASPKLNKPNKHKGEQLAQRMKKTADKMNKKIAQAKVIDRASLASKKEMESSDASLVTILIVILLAILILWIIDAVLPGFLLAILWLAFAIILAVLILRWMGVI